MNAIAIATMQNDNRPRGARFDASCRFLSNPLQGVEHIHNSVLPPHITTNPRDGDQGKQFLAWWTLLPRTATTGAL
jgi:hypothetical protein